MSSRTVIPPSQVFPALRAGATVAMEHGLFMAWTERPGLTARMRAALDFITECWDDGRVSPSYDEIGAALDLRSRSHVARLVASLVQRGYLTRRPGCARSLRPTAGGAE